MTLQDQHVARRAGTATPPPAPTPPPAVDGGPRPGSDRTTARVVGVLYLAGMVLGIGSNLLIQSVLTAPGGLSRIATSGTLLGVGAVLWLATVAGDAAHGVLMFGVLRRSGGRTAVGYLTARILDAVLIAVMVLLIVVQVPLGREYLASGPAGAASLESVSRVLTEANLSAYALGMTAVGVAGLLLCRGFLRARLIPRPLAWWGLVGYAILLGGSVLEILGLHLHAVHAIPGGLWELFIGGWLIVKGFHRDPAA